MLSFFWLKKCLTNTWSEKAIKDTVHGEIGHDILSLEGYLIIRYQWSFKDIHVSENLIKYLFKLVGKGMQHLLMFHFHAPWPSSKSRVNLKSNRVNLVAPNIPIECQLYLPNVRAIQYKLGLEKLTRLPVF